MSQLNFAMGMNVRSMRLLLIFASEASSSN